MAKYGLTLIEIFNKLCLRLKFKLISAFPLYYVSSQALPLDLFTVHWSWKLSSNTSLPRAFLWLPLWPESLLSGCSLKSHSIFSLLLLKCQSILINYILPIQAHILSLLPHWVSWGQGFYLYIPKMPTQGLARPLWWVFCISKQDIWISFLKIVSPTQIFICTMKMSFWLGILWLGEPGLGYLREINKWKRTGTQWAWLITWNFSWQLHKIVRN